MRRFIALSVLTTSLIGLAACSGGSSAIPSASTVGAQNGARRSLTAANGTVQAENGARRSLNGARRSL